MDIGKEHEKQIIEPIKDPLKPDEPSKAEPVREEPVKKPRKEPVKVK